MSELTRVLIVDDTPRSLRVAEGILAAQGIEVYTAENGPDALAVAAAAELDVILLDVMMPGMDGFEVCRRLKADPATRGIPVVMLTALDQAEDRIAALDAGADDFLTKPVNKEELRARIRTLAQVRRLNRMAEQSTAARLRFMAGIAHDIRSPLMAMKIHLRLLKNPNITIEDVQSAAVELEAVHARLAGLAQQMTHYYKAQAGELILRQDTFDLTERVIAAARLVVPMAEQKHIALRLSDNPPQIALIADEVAVSQVIDNLLSNAVKYTPENGTVTVDLFRLAEGRYQLPPDHYPPMLTLPNDGVIIRISDNGIGIPRTSFDRVFREFDRMEEREYVYNQGGMGLGLPLTRRLVQLHGGEIWFTSEENAGSAFTVYLPAERIAG